MGGPLEHAAHVTKNGATANFVLRPRPSSSAGGSKLFQADASDPSDADLGSLGVFPPDTHARMRGHARAHASTPGSGAPARTPVTQR